MKPRLAFTIVFNGLHQLKHKDFYRFMLDNFDYWVLAEGATYPGGTCSWNQNVDTVGIKHHNGRSTDGTYEFLKDLEESHNNIKVITHSDPWPNKDYQSVCAVEEIKKKFKNGNMWMFDIDEQWEDITILESVEEYLNNQNDTDALWFSYNHFVGKNLIARPPNNMTGWGNNPVPRLFRWTGQSLITHNVPRFHELKDIAVLVSGIKFNHYAYYFKEDIKFKEKFYNYTNLYVEWAALQERKEFPVHISQVFSGPLQKENSIIYKMNYPAASYGVSEA